jgi:hypothetical protein
MKFDLVFKKGLCTVARVEGVREVQTDEIPMSIAERVIDVEALLEKLTGLRVHILEKGK